MTEKRLEGMASRQEEFLGKFEKTILDDWKNQVNEVGRKAGLMSPPWFSFQVQRRNHSLVVTDYSGLLRGKSPPRYQAEIKTEKINDNLMVFFSGFKLTKQYKRFLTITTMAVILSTVTVIGIIIVTAKQQIHPRPLDIEGILLLGQL